MDDRAFTVKAVALRQDEILARCAAANARAEEAVRRADAALAVAEERLRRAQAVLEEIRAIQARALPDHADCA